MPADLARALASAGFADGTPVAVAAVGPDGVVAEAWGGMWPDGRLVLQSDRLYAASLAKQVTGAAAAMLVREGQLDPRAAVSLYVSGLPAWASTIAVDQLVHHTAGLPAATVLEAKIGGDWTTDRVLGLLRQIPALPHVPGAGHVYSNAGYVLLAHIVALQSGLDFPEFVTERMLRPYGLAGMRYLADAERPPVQMSLMGPQLPLSIGDCGLWSTAGDFARWLHLMNLDAFGIADLVTAEGRLSNGSSVDYGWGIGLRRRGQRSLYLHGGAWRGARARAARMPDPGLGIVAFAATDRDDELTILVDHLLDELAGS